jgi:hypothetical protein
MERLYKGLNFCGGSVRRRSVANRPGVIGDGNVALVLFIVEVDDGRRLCTWVGFDFSVVMLCFALVTEDLISIRRGSGRHVVLISTCFGRFRVFRVNARKSGLTVGFYPLQLFLQRCVASDQTMALIVSPRAAHQWCGSNWVGSTCCRWDIVQPVMGCIVAIKIVSIWGDTACSSDVETIRLWGSVSPGNV